MKKTITAICCAAVLAACSDSDSDSPQSQIEVQVKNTSGAAVANSAVQLDGKTVLTNSDGIASFSVASSYKGTATVRKDNHMSQQVKVAAVYRDKPTSFDATIIEMEQAGNDIDFSGASVGSPVVVSGSDNATVTISDNNAFVDADGAPYTGLVDVYITPVDVTDDEERYAFPGEYMGIPAAAADNSGSGLPDIDDASMIVSYGMADYTFTDQEGEELFLAEGVQASIDIPMFQEGSIGGLDAPNDGDNIPMWYYDYESMIWIENKLGQGSVVELPTGDLVLRGTVDHFTPWNADHFEVYTGDLETFVECEGGVPAASAQVTAWSPGRSGSYTVTDGSAYGTAAVGTICVTVDSVSCPYSNPNVPEPRAADYSEQCTTVHEGYNSITLRPDLR